MSPAIIGIAAAVAALILIPVAVAIWMNRAPTVEHNESGILPLFSGGGMMLARTAADGVESAADGVESVSDGVESAADGDSDEPAVTRPMPTPSTMQTAPRSHRAVGSDAAPDPRPERQPRLNFQPKSPPRPPPAVRAFDTGRRPVAGDDRVARPSEERRQVQFELPTDGTLQFLPGRLELSSGPDQGREIRFVHLAGPNGAEFTFGRSQGERYRHIQLNDQTVSRLHARMRYHEGRWYLVSLSQTNPVIQSGRELAVGEERVLDDGDRIEFGEVLCTFKSR